MTKKQWFEVLRRAEEAHERECAGAYRESSVEHRWDHEAEALREVKAQR